MAENSFKRILVSGLGGGLDVVNASLLYFSLKQDNVHEAYLGSVRHIELEKIEHVEKTLSDSSALISGKSNFTVSGRFIEPYLARLLDKQLVYISRNYGGKYDQKRLQSAITRVKESLNLDAIVFVDGGGDSLIVQPSDANQGSESTDPFHGGDAELLNSTYNLPDIYQAVISVGLDISPEGFQNNVKLLTEMGGYYGRVNLSTGQKEDFKLDHLFQFKSGFLEPYYQIAEKILVLEANQEGKDNRLPSHTATVTYHALKGNFGLRRTYVRWEPLQADGSLGVIVKEEHRWMYFFDPTKLQSLKLKLNRKEVKNQATL